MSTPEGWKQALDRAVEHPTVLEIMADCADAIDTENHAQHDPEVFGESYDGLKWTALAADLRARASAIRAEDPDIWPMLAAAPTPPEQPVYGSISERAEAGLAAGLWKPAPQGESYLSGVNVEALLRACAELGLSAEHSLEALAAPDVLAEHINRVTRAVIAADRAARKRPEAEAVELMEAADRYARSLARPHEHADLAEAARAEVERLLKGEA